jgi:aminoglycoside phosphotransferase (APT) family kinase protein
VDQEPRLRELQRLGGGREAEIFAIDEGRVLRLARDPARAPFIEREAAALAAARRAGAPVPAVYGRLAVEGRAGTVLDRLDGEDLLVRLGRRPWSVWAVGRLLGRLHARLHRVRAPDELPRLPDELRARLGSELLPADVREAALARLEELPDGDRLCHGDFHPANLLPGPGGYAVIDWTNAARGHPAADVARTRLLVTGGELPADAPFAVRRLAGVGRRLLMAGYLRGYRKELPLDLALVKRWSPVCAAARLAEGIEGERTALLGNARRLTRAPGARR